MAFRNWNLVALLVGAAVALGGCGGGEGAGDDMADDAPAPPPATAQQQPQEPAPLAAGVTREQFDEGQQLFTGSGGCQACHGPQATGTQLGPDLTDDEWLNIEDPGIESIVTLIKTGVATPKEHPAPMPAMGGADLNDDQVRALAGYVLSIAGD